MPPVHAQFPARSRSLVSLGQTIRLATWHLDEDKNASMVDANGSFLGLSFASRSHRFIGFEIWLHPGDGDLLLRGMSVLSFSNCKSDTGARL